MSCRRLLGNRTRYMSNSRGLLLRQVCNKRPFLSTLVRKYGSLKRLREVSEFWFEIINNVSGSILIISQFIDYPYMLDKSLLGC